MSLMVRVHDSMHQGLEGVLTLITIIPSDPLVGFFYLQNLRSAKVKARFPVGECFHQGRSKGSSELDIVTTAWTLWAANIHVLTDKESYSHEGELTDYHDELLPQNRTGQE